VAFCCKHNSFFGKTKDKASHRRPSALHFVSLQEFVVVKLEIYTPFSRNRRTFAAEINTIIIYEGKKTLDNPDGGDDVDSRRRCVRRRAYVRV
jgi:hypothetical protein